MSAFELIQFLGFYFVFICTGYLWVFHFKD